MTRYVFNYAEVDYKDRLLMTNIDFGFLMVPPLFRTSFVSSDCCSCFLNVFVVIAAYHNHITKGCWVGTSRKGSSGSCLAFLPGVHLLFYIPVILIQLLLCTSCIYFYGLKLGY